MKIIDPKTLVKHQATIRWNAMGVVKRQTFNTDVQAHQWIERETKEYPADEFIVQRTIVLPEGMVIGRAPLIGDAVVLPDPVTRDEEEYIG